MNKTYRSVWNESTGTWVAVQENAAACGKKSSSRLASSVAVIGLAAGLGMLSGSAQASTGGSLSFCPSDNSRGNAVGWGSTTFLSLGCDFSHGYQSWIAGPYNFALLNSMNSDGTNTGVAPTVDRFRQIFFSIRPAFRLGRKSGLP